MFAFGAKKAPQEGRTKEKQKMHQMLLFVINRYKMINS
jgi:hypothetical protein